MKPKETQQDQTDLFRSRLDQVLNPEHPLFVLADQIDWTVFDKKLGTLYSEKGRPGKSTRLMVGLHYLKHAFDESDESVVARLLENGFWQYFSGFEYFIHKLPVDPTSMTRWRKRIGSKSQLVMLFQGRLNRWSPDNKLQQNGNPIPTNDIWIAAVALQNGLPLYTLDNHFSYVEGLLLH